MNEQAPPDPKKVQADAIAEMLRRAREPIPPAPPGWNKTVADLLAEATGSGIIYAHPEMDWARDYERSLIPAGYRFPRKGDVYEALRDMPVKYMTDWRAPFTGGGEATLLGGEQVRVYCEPQGPEPLGAYVVPVDYEAAEARVVPLSDREHPKYAGFHLLFTTVELNQVFRLVHKG